MIDPALFPDPAFTRTHLTYVIELLEALDPKRFCYDYFSRPAELKGLATMPTDLNACGTLGCAAGHAAMDPRFQALGLRLRPNQVAVVDENENVIRKDEEDGYLLFGYKALAHIFMVQEAHACFLFCPRAVLYSADQLIESPTRTPPPSRSPPTSGGISPRSFRRSHEAAV